MKRRCELGQVSRSGFYRWRRENPSADGDVQLRDALQRIAEEFPSYGWPRTTRDLGRRGWAVNHKRAYRMMREDNLLCSRRRKFVRNTDSAHPLPVYPNLAREMAVTGLDQLWVADITYIRLRVEFVYLTVILDACSLRVIGWALGRTLEEELTLQALPRALQQRRPAAGLVRQIVILRRIEGQHENRARGIGPGYRLDRRAHRHRPNGRPALNAGDVDGRGGFAGRGDRQLDPGANLPQIPSPFRVQLDVPDQLGFLLQRDSGNCFSQTQDHVGRALQAAE